MLFLMIFERKLHICLAPAVSLFLEKNNISIQKFIKNIKVPLIGMHNIKNVTSVVAVAYSIGISEKIIKNGLSKFKGVQRRFNFLFKKNNSLFIDDYAHHPTEISAVLEGVKEVYNKDPKKYIYTDY